MGFSLLLYEKAFFQLAAAESLSALSVATRTSNQLRQLL